MEITIHPTVSSIIISQVEFTQYSSNKKTHAVNTQLDSSIVSFHEGTNKKQKERILPITFSMEDLHNYFAHRGKHIGMWQGEKGKRSNFAVKWVSQPIYERVSRGR